MTDAADRRTVWETPHMLAAAATPTPAPAAHGLALAATVTARSPRLLLAAGARRTDYGWTFSRPSQPPVAGVTELYKRDRRAASYAYHTALYRGCCEAAGSNLHRETTCRQAYRVHGLRRAARCRKQRLPKPGEAGTAMTPSRLDMTRLPRGEATHPSPAPVKIT